MSIKFEKLNDQLFSEKIDKEKMSKIVGGEASINHYRTYITINTDIHTIIDSSNGNISHFWDIGDDWKK